MNEIHVDDGIRYTINQEVANQLGYKQVSYKVQYIKLEDHAVEEKTIYISKKSHLYKLVNYWNSKSSGYKYWV